MVGYGHEAGSGIVHSVTICPLEGICDPAGSIDGYTVFPVMAVLGDDPSRNLPETGFSVRVRRNALRLPGHSISSVTAGSSFCHSCWQWPKSSARATQFTEHSRGGIIANRQFARIPQRGFGR